MSEPRVVPAPDWTLKLLPDLLAELDVDPVAVLHVGAYHGEEVPIYLRCGFERIGLVEPDPDGYSFMTAQPWATDPRIKIYQVACAHRVPLVNGLARFYRTEGGAWNGLMPSATHRPLSEINVPVVPVSALQADLWVRSNLMPNVLVIDTQGTELDALASADLDALDMIVIETHEHGADGAHPRELARFADQCGWQPAVVLDRTGGWTDTVLVKENQCAGSADT